MSHAPHLPPATALVVSGVVAVAAYATAIGSLLAGASWIWAAAVLLLAGPAVLLVLALRLALDRAGARIDGLTCRPPRSYLARQQGARHV